MFRFFPYKYCSYYCCCCCCFYNLSYACVNIVCWFLLSVCLFVVIFYFLYRLYCRCFVCFDFFSFDKIIFKLRFICTTDYNVDVCRLFMNIFIFFFVFIFWHIPPNYYEIFLCAYSLVNWNIEICIIKSKDFSNKSVKF